MEKDGFACSGSRLSSLVYNEGTSLSLPVPFYRLCFIGFLPAPDSHYLYENENDYSLHII